MPCAPAYDPTTATTASYRVDPATGLLSAAPGDSSGYRQLGTDLIDPELRNPEYIARQVDGRVVWQVPLASLYGPDVSTDSGWDFDDFAKQGTEVGTLYVGTASAARTQLTTNLATDLVTAGFTESAGKLLWQQHGVSVDCAFSLGFDESVPVRCRYTGTVTYVYPAAGSSAQTKTTTANLDVTIEGFDPQTGDTTWRLPMGDAAALVQSGTDTPLLTDDQVLVPTPSGLFVVNGAKGGKRPATAQDVFWCQTQKKFAEAPTPDAGQTKLDIRVGQVVAPCDSALKPTSRAPAGVPSEYAADSGKLRIVSTPTAVVAYRTR